MILPEDLKQLLLAFNAQGVEYLIIGGYAVGVYSEPRATKDLDLFIRSEVRNSEAVYRALAAFGAPITGITPADFRNDPNSVFQIGLPPTRVDILQHISGVTFDDAWEHRTETSVDGVTTHVIAAEHLIRNKLQSGRMRDLADVEAIREANPEISRTIEPAG
jgi:predicted nucleotidyltransferase